MISTSCDEIHPSQQHSRLFRYWPSRLMGLCSCNLACLSHEETRLHCPLTSVPFAVRVGCVKGPFTCWTLWLSLVMSLLKDFGIIQTPHAWPWHQVAAGAIKWLQLHHSETWRQLFCSWPTRVLHNYLCAPSALCSLLQQMACKVASSAWSGFYSKSGKSKFR